MQKNQPVSNQICPLNSMLFSPVCRARPGRPRLPPSSSQQLVGSLFQGREPKKWSVLKSKEKRSNFCDKNAQNRKSEWAILPRFYKAFQIYCYLLTDKIYLFALFLNLRAIAHDLTLPPYSDLTECDLPVVATKTPVFLHASTSAHSTRFGL